MKKYYVKYVENCSPNLAQFSSKKKMNKWVEEFTVYNDGYWVDFTFSSDDLEVLDEGVEVVKK